MASPPLLCSFTTTSTSQFFTKPPYFSGPRRSDISCTAINGGQKQNECTHNPQNEGKFDRRNLLLGIGGLYSTSHLISSNSPATATPIPAPDLTKCTVGVDLRVPQQLTTNCCPPISEYRDYKLPPVKTMRVRPAAHLVDDKYIAKFEKAVAHMKALSDDDPRSFIQQAYVHCAYCDLSYDQSPNSDLKLQIHNSWLFYPWHRWYLYFYERILGKLIDDPSFGLPFWNWDNPHGMVVPSYYTKEGSPLYNERRDPRHMPPTTVDLKYAGTTSTKPPSHIIRDNLIEMYGEMVRNATTLEDFYGAEYVVGTAPDPEPGTIERGSHTAVHRFVGEDTPEGFDLGNFATAGRDLLFYGHHANIDRLWTIWRIRRGSKPKEFSSKDWLEAAFLFYDEDKNLVRVKVKDTLENEKMGYTYQGLDTTPWLTNRPKPRFKKSKVAATSNAPKAAEISFPVTLDNIVKVLVDRPRKSRSKKDKEQEEELLVIEGIEVDSAKFVRFEVFVNDEDDKPEELIDKAEYAGSYSLVPGKKSTTVKSKIRLGLNELLEDLDVEDDDKILVSLVPKVGGENISIGGIKIVYAS